LVNVGEMEGKQHKRMWGHISEINSNVYNIVYQHLNQPDHSIISMNHGASSTKYIQGLSLLT